MFSMTTTPVKFSTNLKPSFFHDGLLYKRPMFCFSHLETTKCNSSLRSSSFKPRAYRERWSFLGAGAVFKNGGLLEEKRSKRVVLVKNFDLNSGGGGGGGGGGKDDGDTARLWGNIAVAIGLTYLSFTGQLGWILDAIVSIWVVKQTLALYSDTSPCRGRSGSALLACFTSFLIFHLCKPVLSNIRHGRHSAIIRYQHLSNMPCFFFPT
ncbi:uncharacterized protein LOC130749060 isoform X2 [Lotus japonicus]|uniref:uncharacterized protein LOC130749060 isoform X2 n=1 Tax=Lotus japonicus TaxID=34305 RepID=UPI002590CBAC|nr:uncharacterized protein LOC130749060 isoform X2 [Lotus japonicus]